jgi:hypothetical protein
MSTGEITFNYPPDAPAPALATVNTADATAAQVPAREADAPVVADLENLIARAQAKLNAMKAESYATDNARQHQHQIDSVESGLRLADQSVAKFDVLIAEALAQLDAVIEAPATIGEFGAPQVASGAAHVQRAALAFAGLRQARFRQLQSRANLEARLSDLKRVQAQHTPPLESTV